MHQKYKSLLGSIIELAQRTGSSQIGGTTRWRSLDKLQPSAMIAETKDTSTSIVVIYLRTRTNQRCHAVGSDLTASIGLTTRVEGRRISSVGSDSPPYRELLEPNACLYTNGACKGAHLGGLRGR
jgi:hypothetical protein